MLTEDVELIDGKPLAYIKSIDSIIASDLHLGYEGVAARSGVFMPNVNLKRIISTLSDAIASTGAARIIITGDIKNEFSNVEDPEFNELYDFVRFARDNKISLTLIKGNHDNFVERYKVPFKLPILREMAQIGGFVFVHGDKKIESVPENTTMLIMGHEHPSIGVTNSIGKRERLRCFLFGKYGDTPLLVLPAMNYFARGTEINATPKSALLSPILKHARIDKMRAIAIGYGSTLDFGTISELRAV